MRRRLLILAALAALLAPAAPAQEITGTITGTVTDQTGAVVPGATVTARNTGTGWTKEVVSTDTGRYTVPFLPVGEYEIVFSLSGFQSHVAKGVNLHVNDRLTVNATLTVGGLETAIEVSAAAEMIQSTPAVQTLMGSTQVQELPLNNRNFVQLATLVPGVSSSLRTRSGSASPARSRSRWPARAATPSTGSWTGFERGRGVEHHPPLDPDPRVDRGVQDHHVELRRGVAAQRRRHRQRGDEERHQHLPGQRLRVLPQRWPQREQLLPQADGCHRRPGEPDGPVHLLRRPRGGRRPKQPPKLDYHNFGFTLGGPVVKDKLFFFGSLEWRNIDRAPASLVATVPDPAWLSDPANANYVARRCATRTR